MERKSNICSGSKTRYNKNSFRIKSENVGGYVAEIIFTVFLGIVIEAISYFRYKYQALAYASAERKASISNT